MKKRILLFDFDGVLVDDFDIIFEVAGITNPRIKNKKEYRKLFEGNFYAEFKKAGLDEGGRRKIEYFKIYAPKLLKLPLIKGVDKILKELTSRYVLIIISSTFSKPIKDFLKKHKLMSYFTEIIGGDASESKVKKIKMIFEKYNASPRDCLFITDTLGDLREAAMAGVRGLAVTWGFHDRKTLIKGVPFACVDKVFELTKQINNYFNLLHA